MRLFSKAACAALIMAAALAAASPALAGWVIVEDNEGDRTTLYMQDNRIRFEERDSSSIMDLAKGTVTFLDPEAKGYWTGTPAQLKAQLLQ